MVIITIHSDHAVTITTTTSPYTPPSLPSLSLYGFNQIHLKKHDKSFLGSSLAEISNGHIDHISHEDVSLYEKEDIEEAYDDEDEGNIRTYKRRFYILLVFALSAFAQYCAWNAFGPIAGTVKAVFGWGNAEIALLASLDPITYLLTMIFFSWMMDVKGKIPFRFFQRFDRCELGCYS